MQKAGIGFDHVEEGAIDVEYVYVVTFSAPGSSISYTMGVIHTT